MRGWRADSAQTGTVEETRAGCPLLGVFYCLYLTTTRTPVLQQYLSTTALFPFIFLTAICNHHVHAQEVCGLKWSFDERLLASGGNDNKLYVWAPNLRAGGGYVSCPSCFFVLHQSCSKLQGVLVLCTPLQECFIECNTAPLCINNNTLLRVDPLVRLNIVISPLQFSLFFSLPDLSIYLSIYPPVCVCVCLHRPLISSPTHRSTPSSRRGREGSRIGVDNDPVCDFSDHIAAVKAVGWSPHQHGTLASGGGTADRYGTVLHCAVLHCIALHCIVFI